MKILSKVLTSGPCSEYVDTYLLLMKQSAEGMSCCSETTFLLSDVQQHPFFPVLFSLLFRCGVERRLQQMIDTDYVGHPSVSESRTQSFDVCFSWQGNKVMGAVKVLEFET